MFVTSFSTTNSTRLVTTTRQSLSVNRNIPRSGGIFFLKSYIHESSIFSIVFSPHVTSACVALYARLCLFHDLGEW